MTRKQTRILATGYAMAAIFGAALASAGSGAVSALLGFWLSGPAAVLALALASAARRGDAPCAWTDDSRNDAAFAFALRVWARDRSAGRPTPLDSVIAFIA